MNEIGFVARPGRVEDEVAESGQLVRAAELLQLHISSEVAPYVTPVTLETLLGEMEPEPWRALGRLKDVFALTRFEAGLLVTLAAISIDPVLAASTAAIQGQSRTGLISFALAARLLPECELAALRPDAPLRLWRLIEIDSPPEAAAATLFRIDERVLYYLAGVKVVPDPLVPVASAGWLAPSQHSIAARLAALLKVEHGAAVPAIQLCGEDIGALRALVAEAGDQLGLQLLRIAAAGLPQARAELAELARRCSRDLALSEAILLIEASEGSPEGTSAAAQFAGLVEGLVVIAARTPLPLGGRPALRVDVPALSFDERRIHWSLLAPSLGDRELDKIVRTFSLDGAGRIAAVRLAGPEADAAALWAACRDQSREGLEGLAQRITSAASWNDLVLPETQCELLREIVDHVDYAGLVLEHWRFETRLSRGTGIAALFAGPSGTGKTLAAEVLGNALERDLYRIDLSQVVSKYIGETEKNLARIFATAEGAGAILLFDEADALFGKRSEVQDSHDRYANIEVSYLLQRMETYTGLSILTTNLKDALDKAFLRRLRFIVQFAYPNADQRRQIWQRAFPAELPTQGLDFDRLGQYDLTGGAIRNVALAAAFFAARDGGPVTMAHCAAAATREYQKLEKPLGARGTDRRR